MSTRRVEVSKETSIPHVGFLSNYVRRVFKSIGALGRDMVGYHVLHGGFGIAIGICGTDWALFRNGDHVGKAGCVAVDGRGGGEDDVGNIVAGHGTEETEGTVDIDMVIIEGSFTRFTDGLKGCEWSGT